MTQTLVQIPAQLKPADGRFGSGPSKVPASALDALRIEGAAHLEGEGRALAVPRRLFVPHPLHADRPARGAHQERGVRNGVFVALAAANLSSFPPGPS